MSIVAEKILTEVKALSADEMRQLLHDIEQVLEDMEDSEDAERVTGKLERGETATRTLDEVMQTLGITDADLDRQD
jgi:CHASE3 domain sensor protein